MWSVDTVKPGFHYAYYYLTYTYKEGIVIVKNKDKNLVKFSPPKLKEVLFTKCLSVCSADKKTT